MYENEQTEKLKQYQEKANQATSAPTPFAMRPNLRERVDNSLYRSEIEAGKAHACRELAQLLERNPEVARILELIEALMP